MIDLFDDIDLCSFEENQVLFLILVTVILKSLESGHIFITFSELLPVCQREPVCFAVRKLFD